MHECGNEEEINLEAGSAKGFPLGLGYARARRNAKIIKFENEGLSG